MSTIRKEVSRLKGYSLTQDPHRIKLNQNESPFDLPAPLKQKAMARLSELSWNRYPTPFCDALRKKIAEKEGWSAEGVVVTGGSNILIQAIMIAAAIQGKILTVTPSFSLYGLEGQIFGNKVIEVPLKKDFSFPRDLFLKSLKKERPQIVFLANPNAPTGNLFSEEDLVSVLKASQGLVVVDEAYYPFSGFTLRPYLKQFPNLILLRTFSKAFSMGGVRLGYMLSHPAVASEILKVILPFTIGILTQAIAEVVLEEDSFVRSLVKEILEERERLYKNLGQIKSLKVFPSQTNFILFQSPRSREIFHGLGKEGILIRDVSAKNLPHALRVSIGTRDENLRFLQVMQRLLA